MTLIFTDSKHSWQKRLVRKHGQKHPGTMYYSLNRNVCLAEILEKSEYASSLLQYLSGEFITWSPRPNSMLFILINSSLLFCNIFGDERGEGEGGSKIACQRNPVLSDPVVPRTFVVDCSSLVSSKQLLCFMHGQGYEKQQNHTYIHVHTYIS